MPNRSDQSPELGIQRITHARAYEEVVRQLRARITAGTIAPGSRLPPERQMAEQFGVSRATLRQALSALSGSGLIESRVGAGTFVRHDAAGTNVNALVQALRMVPGTLGDQLGLRRIIEPQVAREAADHAQSMDLDYLRQSIARQEAKVGAGEPFADEDSTFHLAIAQATQNPLVVKMVEGIHELLRESRERSLRAPDGLRRSFEGHRRILAAIEGGDGRAAYEAMASHIADVERLSLEQITEEPSLTILGETQTAPEPPTAPGRATPR